MLPYFVIFPYVVLLAYSLVVVYQRKTFDDVQKRIHAIISLVFPLWGILIRHFPDKPVDGSHYFPNKRNKYGDSYADNGGRGDGIPLDGGFDGWWINSYLAGNFNHLCFLHVSRYL